VGESFVKTAEKNVAEVDVPRVIVDFTEPHSLPLEGVAQAHEKADPLYVTTLLDLPSVVVAGILDLRQPARERAGRGRVEGARRFLPECLVRPLVIVFVAEGLEPMLLASDVPGRWLGSLLLEG